MQQGDMLTAMALSPPDALHESSMFEAEDLTVYFPAGRSGLFDRKYVHAVDGVSFLIREGEVFGLVGESGSGKTTIGRVLCRLTSPTSGTVLFEGKDITRLRGESLKKYRRQVQMIFQDPYESLNPYSTVLDAVTFPMRVQGLIENRNRATRDCEELLDRVGLRRHDVMNKYPHELSGGERQRVSIARALAVRPRFIVADEPVSMLDISIQAGILNLMMDLKKEYGLTYMLITHDLRVTHYMSDRIAVMYLGKLVELAPGEELMKHQFHPYSQLLVSSAASFELGGERKETWSGKGEIPSAIDPPSGCRFHPRCPFRVEECDQEEPQLRMIRPNHYLSCFNPQ